ncbi:NAD-dependent epimerase/dehydratase family protein [Sulfoacidibacillus thermotolerans]|uniref:NAD-dependent epimerase/dehydratase domain-containing protein n=1 Tax=Sulfoacidibacillus thermotolerans TaxID=1765684 RepID=A0A2U3D7A0_SULT2|nr:NAD-dependent epimerase/dehydratase family protein [Sulfoacidibacillus thermotolerans]PWI57155.1 hypothetical protein BM613_09795 [Sulfoacidibacillus thermotolerans]
MRAIVTGGNGFIGSHIVDALVAQGDEVAVIDIQPPTEMSLESLAVQVELDISSQDAENFIAEYQPDVIFHLAAKASVPASIKDPIDDAKTTLLGMVRVLEGAHKAGARKVVFSSSAAVYGDPTAPLPLAETTPLDPISPYGVAKAAAEAYLKAFYHLYGVQYAALRYANVYGPRQGVSGEGGVIAIFAERIVREEPLHLFGDGLHTRDYIYVEDVVRANLLAGQYEGNIICNVSTGIETSNAQLISYFEQVAGREISVLHKPERSGDIRRNALLPDLAKSVLGFTAKTELHQGLFTTYQWMVKHWGRKI